MALGGLVDLAGCRAGGPSGAATQLTDAQWKRIESLLPCNGRPGGQWADHREVVNRVLFRARTGVEERARPPLRGAAMGARAARLRRVAKGFGRICSLPTS
ncbi:transposase [Streptomyces sp. NBC_01450]|uniref:transposase n=1 Tax=Streptomyces sp. NBC_01450 TaxID=2903871 RepID=UPI003FCC4333